MSHESETRWLARHADWIYKILLVALIGLWVAFPPHASQPSAGRPQVTLTNGGPT